MNLSAQCRVVTWLFFKGASIERANEHRGMKQPVVRKMVYKDHTISTQTKT